MSIVHPREIFKEAYLLSAACIICIHNHPSGSALPSEEDKKMTSNLVKIGKLLGIEVIDHIIICEDEFYSFYENNDI
jgi:DNA repair protein RadC